MNSESIREKARAGYGQIAQSGGCGCGSTPGCCGSSSTDADQLAQHASHSAERAQTKHASVLEVYDPALCCSTGVCGPAVDPVLVRFAADVKWLLEQGVEVRRFNLSQTPAAFVENEVVKQALTEKGEAALPLLFVDSQMLASGHYPERRELAASLNLKATATPAPAKSSCCGGGAC